MNSRTFFHLPACLWVRAAVAAVLLVCTACPDIHAGAPEKPVVEAFVASGDVRRSGKPEGATVYVIDRIHRLQAGLSRDLPGDPQAAREIVLERFGRIGTEEGQQLENAARGLVRAMRYGIDRYPAIVFDGQAVVYGVRDIEAARRIWRRWQAAQGG